MRQVLLGEVIKARRKAMWLTQEQLCEGICEPVTLSRIENGRQNPSYNKVKALLQRLDLPDDRYTALLTYNEQELEDRKTKVKLCAAEFWDAAAEEKPRRREAALKALADLEEIVEPDDNLTRQYAAGVRVHLGKEDGPYTLEEKLDLLLNAIRLTIPHFDLERIDQFLYSEEELDLTAQVAVAYALAKQSKQAIDLYRQLFDYIQAHQQNVTRYASDLGFVAFNYSRELMVDGNYCAAVEIAEIGRQVCTKYAKYHSLAGILSVLANCYSHLNQKERSGELYFLAYSLYKIVGNENNIEHLRNDARDTLNLELSQINLFYMGLDQGDHPVETQENHPATRGQSE